MTVLVVDEDSSGSKLARTALTTTGRYSVILAENGKEALATLAAGRGIRLVITGFRVPGANGAEIARRAKELIPNVKVLVLTSEDKDFVWPVVSAAGADALLQKPFSIGGLREEVEKLLAS